MFGWGVHVIEQPARLILIVPFPWVFMLIFTPVVTVFGFIYVLSSSGHYWRKGLILAAVILVYGFVCSASELTLDVPSNTATLREFEFFHWSVDRYPLSDVDRLIVRTGSQSSALLLQFRDGSVEYISHQDQTSGKQEAAYKVNAWLARSGH